MTESKVWYHYRMLAPVREWYRDDDTRILARVPVESDMGPLELALVGDESGPESIRVRLEHPTGDFPEGQRRVLMQLTSHMLTCLRLMHNHEAEFASYGGQFLALMTPGDADGRPGLKVRIERLAGAPRPFPRTEVEATFVETFHRHALFDLLADSQRSSVPLQYQYLSLFKILEHEFRIAGRWGERLRELLEPHDEEFQKMDGVKRSLHSEVHDLRDRSAHIKIGKTEAPGIAGLGSRDVERVSRLLPLLRRIVTDHLLGRYGLKRIS